MGDDVPVMSLAEWFAEPGARGMVTRMVGAWVFVGLPLIAARIWWSVPAAIIVFMVTVTTYVAVAVRYKRRHRRQAEEDAGEGGGDTSPPPTLQSPR